MALPTLLDIAVRNGSDAMVGLVDETTKAHPELSLGFARTIKGINYKTRVRTALGNASGSFRDANAGVTPHKHTYENRLVETYILSPRFEVDKAVADRSEDGVEAYLAEEAVGTMEGEMQALAKQFYYGNALGVGNSSGFPGLLDMLDTTNMVVDAGGTTGDTGSSVWAVKFGPRAVAWVWGVDGLLEMSPHRIETIADPADATKKLVAYVQDMLAYPGLQVTMTQAFGRIKKLTADSGKGLTDSLIADLLAKFPTSIGRPDVLLMTPRSQAQLQKSRTATTPTGAPAPFPTESHGVPIALTEAILNTESLTAY